LSNHLSIHLFQICIILERFCLFGSPLSQVWHDTLEVENTVFRRFYSIVAKIFRLSSRIITVSLTAISVYRISFFVQNPLIQDGLLCLRSACLKDWSVAPHDRIFVIRTYVWHQAHALVARLRDVVESSVVHDRWSSTKFFGKGSVTKFFY